MNTKDLILFRGQVLQKVRTSPIYIQATEYRNIEGGDTVLVMNCDHEAKHDDLLLVSLKNRGIPQKTIALVFGKSDTWVTQNLQRLGAIDPPKPRSEAAEPQTGQMTMNDVISKAENWDDIVAIPNSEFHKQANQLWGLLIEASQGQLYKLQELFEQKFPGTFIVSDSDNFAETELRGRIRFDKDIFDEDFSCVGYVDNCAAYLRHDPDEPAHSISSIVYLGEVDG